MMKQKPSGLDPRGSEYEYGRKFSYDVTKNAKTCKYMVFAVHTLNNVAGYHL